MKHLIFLLTLVVLSSCSTKGTNSNETTAPVGQDSIRAAIVAERVDMVAALVKVGKEGKLCDDIVSFEAYDKADSILKSIDTTDFKKALAKTYVANSYLFYGASYVNTVMAQSRRIYTGLDCDEVRFPSFEGYEDLLDADSLSWFDLSIMDAWSVNGMTFTTYVINDDSFAQMRREESDYDIAQINIMKDVLKDERLFAYATVLNAKCYFNNMFRLYASEYGSRHNGDVPPFIRQPAIEIATRLDSMPIAKMEAGTVSQEDMLSIQLQCAKLLNEFTKLWIGLLNQEYWY